MTRPFLSICLLFLVLGPRPAAAQLATPGPSGVVLGHIHFLVKDVDASRKFWLALGGERVIDGSIEMIRFPGVLILLRQGDPKGGSAGSVVNHIGFQVKSLARSTEA